MKRRTDDSRQLTFLEGTAQAIPPKREQSHQRHRKPLLIRQTPAAPPPPHRAARGDMFREIAEAKWAAPDFVRETTEALREKVYRHMSSTVTRTSYRRRKKLCGPVQRLRRQVGSNRYCEFSQWLTQIRCVRGASVPVQYDSLLSMICGQIDEIAIEYRYTFDDFDNSSFYGPTRARDLLKAASDLLSKAREDVAELQPLLAAMSGLYGDLGSAKRAAARPPPTVEEENAQRERLAHEVREHIKAARVARVGVSRKWLREYAEPVKHNEDDVRGAGGWISMEAAVEMVQSDLHGFANEKPLWPTLPTVDQLAVDYRLSKKAAARVLAAYNQARSEDAARGQ
jgi:hypothetical protein